MNVSNRRDSGEEKPQKVKARELIAEMHRKKCWESKFQIEFCTEKKWQKSVGTSRKKFQPQKFAKLPKLIEAEKETIYEIHSVKKRGRSDPLPNSKIGLKSGLYGGHSKMRHCLAAKNSFMMAALGIGALSC